MPEASPSRAVAALGRLVLNFRLVTVLLAVLYRPQGGRLETGLAVALLVSLAVSFVPLIRWERLAPVLMRHPTFLAVDLVLSVGILLATGTDGPFLSYTLGTAVLAGALYSWTGAVVFSTLLVAAYGAVLWRLVVAERIAPDFEALVGTPSRYVLFALGGAAVRGLLVRQAQAEIALAAATRNAASSAERARLAREMHDTLAKTLLGIAMAARALPLWIERDPSRAQRTALELAGSAETAAREARELIGDLRAEGLTVPLAEAVEDFTQEWASSARVRLSLETQPVDGVLTQTARYELFAILRESLRNVERHARATAVDVALVRSGPDVVLRVSDDGVGLPEVDLDELKAQGHFGLVGMRERAAKVGGRVEFLPRCPTGVTVAVTVPEAGADRNTLATDAVQVAT